MARGRPLAPLRWTDAEHESLQRWIRRRKTAQTLALRAQLVLLSAQELSNQDVAARLHITLQTVSKWRGRFMERGLDGLMDEPRPGAPRTISDADVKRVITLTLETAPVNATPWSTRLIASRRR